MCKTTHFKDPEKYVYVKIDDDAHELMFGFL